MKIIFAGTPDFAVPTLQALLSSTHEIVAVLTQPDRPAGRGQQLQASPVKQLAAAHQLPIFQPTTLRDQTAQNMLKQVDADVMVVVAYGLILPQAVLDIPKYGCINLHPSLLPRWRGAAPIQRTIEAGDQETAITIMQMDKGMDTGAVLLQEKFALTGAETSGTLHDHCAKRGAVLMLDVLSRLNTLTPVAQENEGATHAKKIEKSESLINWEKTVAEIDSHMRAMNPWPVATTLFQDQPIKIFEAKIISHEKSTRAVGVLFQDKHSLCVAAKDGVLEIISLQLPGKKIMSAKDFLHGYGKHL